MSTSSPNFLPNETATFPTTTSVAVNVKNVSHRQYKPDKQRKCLSGLYYRYPARQTGKKMLAASRT